MTTHLRGRTRRRGAAIGVALVAGIGGLATFGTGALGATVPDTASVSLCHATQSGTNPYNLITVNAAGAFNGHLNQPGKPAHQWGNDIIPPFTYEGTQYSQNWPAGQGLFNNGCFALKVQKTGDLTVEPGSLINYSIVVTNLGEVAVPISSVTVEDPMATLTPPAQPPDSIPAGGTATWTAVSKIAVPAESASCGSTVTNTATVTFAPDPIAGVVLDPGVALQPAPSTSDSWTTTVVCPPRVSIVKTATNGPVAPGGTATYDVTVKNTGFATIPFADIQVLDEGATLTDPENTGPVAPGDSRVWTAAKNVATDTPCDIGTVSNTATVNLIPAPLPAALKAGIAVDANTTSTATTDVVCPVDVAVSKTTTSTTVVPGGSVPYGINVTNTSAFPVPFSAITVTDEGATITPPVNPPAFLAPNASLTWTASKVAADGTTACGTTVANTAQVTLVGLPAGYSAITPAGSSSTASPVTISGGICDTPIAAQGLVSAAIRPTLSLRKVGPAIAQRGSGVTYRIRVTNTSAVTATDVVISDTVPGVMRIAGTSPGATRSGRTITWSIGDLAPGASRTVSVMVGMRAAAGRTACNTASAVAGNADRASGRACTRVQASRRVVVTG